VSVGERIRPLDWAARSLGTLRFTADLPGQHLHGAVLRSPHPYAEIVTLDIGPALRMRGVHAVITAEDFPPGITYLHRGAPLSDRSPLAAGVVRHVGQEVAAVAADTPELARAACAAIRVRYRVRRAPLTVAEARRPGVLRLHDRTTAEPNVSMLLDVAWGDVAAGLAASTVSVSGSFVYPSLSHAVMEPNTTLASWVDGRVELWTSTQAPWFIQKEVSHLLGIPHDDVVIREVAVGGGFGSKSKISEHEVLAAALSRKAGRSVLLQQSREEEFASNKPRHRFETTLVTHADAHGVIRALEADVVVDNGSYNHMGTSVMRVGVITLGSMYRPDGVRFSARLVDTATQPGGQFRGYGTPQVSLAMESQIDELAERLGLDPLDLRLRNLAEENTTSLCGYEVGTNRLGDCLLAVRDAVDWTALKTDRTPGRGVGVAAGSHGSGAYAYELANRSDAAIDLFDDGRVRVRFGGADAGTGQSTILAQVAAEELGVPVDRVEVLSMDSDRTPFDLGAWSSRGTHMTGFSVGQAARELAAEVLALGAMKLGTTEVWLRDGAVESDQGSVELADLVRLSRARPTSHRPTPSPPTRRWSTSTDGRERCRSSTTWLPTTSGGRSTRPWSRVRSSAARSWAWAGRWARRRSARTAGSSTAATCTTPCPARRTCPRSGRSSSAASSPPGPTAPKRSARCRSSRRVRRWPTRCTTRSACASARCRSPRTRC
jgi:CO/xanthine dehydrogenase Mo-binding subunit